MVRFISYVVCFVFLVSCTRSEPQAIQSEPFSSPIPTLDIPGELVSPQKPELASHPLLQAYLQRVEQALTLTPPILPLEGLDLQQDLAQTIALADAQVQSLSYDPQTNAPQRMEVFGVVPWRESDRTNATTQCSPSRCYRVELFNYARNTSVFLVVDTEAQKVLALTQRQGTQPDIPTHLTELAREIAIQAPEVQAALGYAPSSEMALMANTKTALNESRCERSEHLCVAPTFVQGDKALWAIVDLTEPHLVGLRWTNVGTTGPAVTEKSLQNEAVLYYCDNTTTVERDGWRFEYILTSSDGLRISDVQFEGETIIRNAKLVDWHVNYSDRDGFGYSDAVGCPYFSQAAVVAIRPPEVNDLREGDELVGFSLTQEFWSELWPQPCNYYYAQTFEFYLDGSFRPKVASMGRGCGDDGTYRPVTRIALPKTTSFADWDGSAWRVLEQEFWQAAEGRLATADGMEYRLQLANGRSYAIATAQGQFADGGRGDQAYVYVTRYHADVDEGESDMITIGPCCNLNEEQGPEVFIDVPPEPIADQEIVLWYVAQLKNDGRKGQEYCWAEAVLEQGVYSPIEYPCWSGPMFMPLEEAQP
jgi:hypothetical protein